VGPRIARHFVKAEIKAFSFAEFDVARAWAAAG
jgi:hypothetical protein